MTEHSPRESPLSPLLHGPRGRRFLLEYAFLSERLEHPGGSLGALAGSVRVAADRLEPTITPRTATFSGSSQLSV